MKKILYSLLLLVSSLRIYALPDEGMWIPTLIGKYNIKLMQEKGFKLNADDIYSVNKACMKDAVVLFGGGCTGELISDKGLLITNHHCGFSQIQKLSSLEHDYLTNGFWAMSDDQELSCPGLSVTFLKRMEDVTEKMLNGVEGKMDKTTMEKILNTNSEEIRKTALGNTDFTASIKPFYMGNQYFLLVYETFTDIRLVGAPPSAIGKFGDMSDNWIWPRHTGDFSLFRIYASKDNKPADFSRENVPYKPLYHFPVSLKKLNEGDFTMVIGYPGSTSEYAPSYYIDMVKNYINPRMIALRSKKIEIMQTAMNADPEIRIQYASKKFGLDNSWKRWIGESQGLERMNTIGKKQEYEENLLAWINADESRKLKYGNILSDYKNLYSQFADYSLVNSYTNDVFFIYGAEAVGFARNMNAFADMFENNPDTEKIRIAKNELINTAKGFFRNYDTETDKKLFSEVMTMYGDNIESSWQAPEYIKIRNSCMGDFKAFAENAYNKTIFSDEPRFMEFVRSFNKGSLKKLKKDPFFLLSKSVNEFLNANVRGELNRIYSEIQALNSKYMVLQMEYDKDRMFYPDANLTMRIAYGSIKGYYPADAVYYKHFTTLKGLIGKDNPDIYDYAVPEKLKQLYITRDYGRYSQDGELPVCFIADNHTSGGNSGSPVINSDGHLIGINFDRAWEGVASDIAFNSDLSRNISLDIRFVLFIIDKFAGAGYLLNEMTIMEQ